MKINEKPEHWYLHVDLDAFFASVEQLDNPELRGKPVIVGGKPEDRRSVVSTASYEARAFGVHSAMPTFQAYRLCPQGIFVHGRMHRYAELSHQIMNIFRDYSPDVDQMSIDEAFIDLTGTEKLFGPPKETALAIKARVKAETGLTVSVGLATTKYLAKIASGLSKPDGFFVISPGNEQSFMLNLPLNKVWGLGPKSLELIRSKGLTSTRDIFEKDYNSLEFLFGKNMAGFLYNVVRGIEKESFSRETKSHSISAETTFPYDLTDIYAIETELLELAHGVFFRLLKEESFSRTAFVKIRYDDFSTSTVQETVERNIITLDSFFEIIKRLFEKRYQTGRGIRLLGVGFENIVKEEKPYQQDLFSTNNDKKKQAVEKAILKLSKKHPEIKVSKARTLKALLFALVIGAAPFQLNAQEAEDVPIPEAEEPPVYLFNYDINDETHVDFSASGLWKMEFTTGLNITFGNGTETAFSPALPVFKQETDFSALLTINNSWYFEAAFADEFSKNTMAFGYRGDGLVRHFRLANRGVTMSEGYSAEHFGYALRGGSNQAPGMLLQLVSPSEKIQADFLLRYDMTETKSEIYYGMNKVSDIKIRADDFAYGREFHFPKEASQQLFQIKNIYIEDKAGSYTDGRGRPYRKLRSDEYALVRTEEEHRLYISGESEGGKDSDGNIPSILLTFAFSADAQAVVNKAGEWSNQNSFLGRIQQTLGDGGKYNLQNYAYNMLTTIDDENALIIQNYEGFSPFLCPSIYAFGTKKEADYLVIADKSEKPVLKYKAFEAEETYTNLYQNFFDKEQCSVRVYNKEDLSSVYPFAEDCPEIYLNIPQKTDLAIRARTWSPVTEILISKKAAAGTVQVYKNGYLLTGAVYNENTGVIELNTPVADTDQLLITWQEEATDFSSGALAAAAGLKLDILPELKADFSLTTLQPVKRKGTMIESGSQKNSFTAFAAGITYEKEGLKLNDKTAVSLLNDNTAEGLELYSWEDILEDYEDEKESNPKKILIEPQKTNIISFKEQDFSPYKEISIEIDFSKNEGTAFSGPLTLIIDEDTGTSDSGAEAVYLLINNITHVCGNGGKHTITIATDKSEVLADGTALSKEDYTLQINKEVIPSRLTLETSSESQKALVEKLSFKDSSNYGTFRNYVSAEYKKDGTIVKVNDFDLIKDIHAGLQSDQGTGNFSEPEPFVTAKTEGGLTLSGIKLSADLAMQNIVKNADITEAGHSVKTDESFKAFKIISVGDTYRYKPSANEVRKENVFSLNLSPVKFPFTAKLQTSASQTAWHGKQNSEISAGYTQKLSDIEIGINGKLKLSQKLQSDFTEVNSYTQSWFDISELEFSTGKAEASARDTLWSSSLNGSLPLKNSGLTIKPKLTYELSDTYRRDAQATETSSINLFSDKEFLQLLIPFSTEKKSLSFEISRTGGGNSSIETGGDYKSDTQKLFAMQSQRGWFYKSIPFYELFDSNLKDKIDAGYAAKYEGNFRRTLYNSKKDLFIPSALTLALTREITQQQPEADLYQVKLVITNNSINNFGSNSVDKTFLCFTQEELTTSLTTILKIPRDQADNLKLNIQTFAQLLLFVTEKKILTEQFEFSIEDAAEWNVRNTLSWARPSETSLLTSLVHLIAPTANTTNYAISRKDTLTVDIGKTDALRRQKYSYNHTIGIDFLEYYNVNAGIGGSLQLNQNLADIFTIELTLGAKAEF